MIAGDAIRITPPAALPVSLAEFKAHLRVTDDSEDAYVAGLIRVATEEVEEFTGLALITSTWRQTFSAPTVRQPLLTLRRRPLQSVVSIDYRTDVGSPVGAMALLDPSAYVITGIGYDKTPGAVRLGYLGSWPQIYYGDSDAIQVTYTAGFGDDHNSIPEIIRYQILRIAATRYAFREDVVMGSSVSAIPYSSQEALRPWRPLAVA